ncbi:hypothetical protein [Mesorhizobium sp. ArgA1]
MAASGVAQQHFANPPMTGGGTGMSVYKGDMKTTATYDSAAGTFTLVKDQWRGTFPIADLPGWIAFYRQQQHKYPDHAASYASDVEALEALAANLCEFGSQEQAGAAEVESG